MQEAMREQRQSGTHTSDSVVGRFFLLAIPSFIGVGILFNLLGIEGQPTARPEGNPFKAVALWFKWFVQTQPVKVVLLLALFGLLFWLFAYLRRNQFSTYLTIVITMCVLGFLTSIMAFDSAIAKSIIPTASAFGMVITAVDATHHRVGQDRRR